MFNIFFFPKKYNKKKHSIDMVKFTEDWIKKLRSNPSSNLCEDVAQALENVVKEFKNAQNA